MENKQINGMENTRPLNKEEFDAFGKDMEALLEKHNCEIGVSSTIQVMKRTNEVKEDSIKSPFIVKKDNGNNPTKS
jgi:hypothetical protein